MDPFIARDFKEFIRISGMTPCAHLSVLAAVERKIGAMAQIANKANAFGRSRPLTLECARRLIQSYVVRKNTVRLHSAIGYATPAGYAGGATGGDSCGA